MAPDAAEPAVAETVTGSFEPKRWVADAGFELAYYTFTPAAERPAAGFPLVVALHGTEDMIDLGGEGSHLINRETVKGWVAPDVQAAHRPYVLAPQVSLAASWNDRRVQRAMDGIIRALIDEGMIDPKRIYLVGHSVGGAAAWLYPVALETQFAAIAPMSGFWAEADAELPLAQAAREVFPSVAIWSFHHANDPGGGVRDSRYIADTLAANGLALLKNEAPRASHVTQRSLYTEYTDASLPCFGVDCHQICDVAIRDPVVVEWLFRQRRDEAPAPNGNGQLVNLSARSFVGMGVDVQIAGFVIDGLQPKTILIRANGPALVPLGVSEVLADPRLDLHDQRTGTVITSNDNWDEDPVKAEQLQAVANRVGASPWTRGSNDAAVLVTLAPGVYSAVVHGVRDSTGIAVVEVYDADVAPISSELVNISVRAQARTGEQVQIAGFVITGPQPVTVLVRANGPALQQPGLPHPISDPVMTLHDQRTKIVLASNDDWSTDSAQAARIEAAAQRVGASAWVRGSADAAILITLGPGIYTAVISPSPRNSTPGNALVEVFAVNESR